MSRSYHHVELIKSYKGLKKGVSYYITGVNEAGNTVNINNIDVPIFLLTHNAEVKSKDSKGTKVNAVALYSYNSNCLVRCFVYNQFYGYLMENVDVISSKSNNSCLFLDNYIHSLPAVYDVPNIIYNGKTYHVSGTYNGRLQDRSGFLTYEGKPINYKDVEFIYENMTSAYFKTQEELENAYPQLKHNNNMSSSIINHSCISLAIHNNPITFSSMSGNDLYFDKNDLYFDKGTRFFTKGNHKLLLPNAVLNNTGEAITALYTENNVTFFLRNANNGELTFDATAERVFGNTSSNNVRFVKVILPFSCVVVKDGLRRNDTIITAGECGRSYRNEPVWLFGQFDGKEMAYGFTTKNVYVDNIMNFGDNVHSSSTKIDKSKSEKTHQVSPESALSVKLSDKVGSNNFVVNDYTMNGGMIVSLSLKYSDKSTASFDPYTIIKALEWSNAYHKVNGKLLLVFENLQHGLYTTVDVDGNRTVLHINEFVFTDKHVADAPSKQSKYTEQKRHKADMMEKVNLVRVKCDNISQVNRVIKVLCEEYNIPKEDITYWDVYGNECNPAYKTFKELGKEYNVWFDKTTLDKLDITYVNITRDCKKDKYGFAWSNQTHHTMTVDEFKAAYGRTPSAVIPELEKESEFKEITEEQVVKEIFGEAVQVEQEVVEESVRKPQQNKPSSSKLDW